MLHHIHHAGLQLSNFNEATLFYAFCSCYEINRCSYISLNFRYTVKFLMVKGPFRKLLVGRGGGGGGAYIRGAYTWRNICVLKTLYFVHANVIF